MTVVRLTKKFHPVVRVDPDIHELIKIKRLQDELATDLNLNQAGAGRDVGYHRELLYSYQRSYFRRHGKVADVQRLQVKKA